MSSFFTPSFAPLSGEILIYKLELGASSGHKNERVKVGNHKYVYIYRYVYIYTHVYHVYNYTCFYC